MQGYQWDLVNTVPCDSATCPELPQHTWLSSHSLEPAGRTLQIHPLKKHSRNLPPEHRSQTRHSHTLTASHPSSPTGTIAQQIWLSRAHLGQNSSMINIMETTTSIMALEKVSEIIISIKIPPSICFKLSSTITEPREQWSGWEEPCCQTLTSKAWTSTAALYYVLYLMKMPRLPHFFAIREALTKTWTCVCCAPELLMAAASAIGYSTTKQNSKCFCRRISIPSCSPQC